MSHSTNREPIGVIGTGYVGLVTAAGFAELGNDVWCIDIDEAKIEGLKQGRIPIWEPGLAELVERHRDRLHFSTDLGDALEHARLLFVAVGTPPTYSGDADLSAVHAVVEAMPASDRHALVMKSTVPVGTGATIKRAVRRAGQGLLLRLLPRVPQGGLGGQGLPGPRPRRRRRRRRLGRRRRRRALRAARRAARAHGHQERRDGQARLQRVPGHEDLVHQRDRQRLRGDRRGRRRGRQGHGPGQPHRPEVPAGRHRLRRLVLPEGRHRAQAARRQLGLPLPAAQLGDRGQRAAEAARDGQAREAPRLARRQGDRRCSAWPSSPTPTTCARPPRSCSPRGCRRPARACASTTRSPRRRRAS